MHLVVCAKNSYLRTWREGSEYFHRIGLALAEYALIWRRSLRANRRRSTVRTVSKGSRCSVRISRPAAGKVLEQIWRSSVLFGFNHALEATPRRHASNSRRNTGAEAAIPVAYVTQLLNTSACV